MSCSDNQSPGKSGCCGGCSSQGSKPTSGIERRTFMKYLLGIFALLWGVVASYPFIRYLSSGAKPAAATQVSTAAVGTVSDFPVGSGKNVEFGGKPAIVIHAQDGTFHAYNAVCTHLGCTVQFDGQGQQIICACHGGQYDAVTGDVIAGPPPKALSPYRVKVEGETVILSRV